MRFACSGDFVEWAAPAILPDARRHGDRGILFLDEITSAPPSVSAAAYQLILDRRLGEYEVPDGWAIFAVMAFEGTLFLLGATGTQILSHFFVPGETQ